MRPVKRKTISLAKTATFANHDLTKSSRVIDGFGLSLGSHALPGGCQGVQEHFGTSVCNQCFARAMSALVQALRS